MAGASRRKKEHETILTMERPLAHTPPRLLVNLHLKTVSVPKFFEDTPAPYQALLCVTNTASEGYIGHKYIGHNYIGEIAQFSKWRFPFHGEHYTESVWSYLEGIPETMVQALRKHSEPPRVPGGNPSTGAR